MPQQLINHLDPLPDGDTPKSGAVKVNENFAEVYAALTTKEAAGTATTSMNAHLAAVDPHAQYVLDAERGVASGIATLGTDTKVPTAQLPPLLALSNANPLTGLITPTPGTGTTAARTDHRHPIGGVWHLRFETGGLYGPYNNAFTNTAQATGNLHVMPFFVPEARTFDQILINVATAGAGPIRLGIYNDTGTGYPGSLLLSAGTVDSAVLGELAITISQNLTPGVYWLAALTETTTNAVVTSGGGQTLGMRAVSNNGTSKGYQAGSIAAGALPATFPAALSPITLATIRVLLRAA